MIIIINKGFSTSWPKSESQMKCYNWDILFIYKCTKDLKLLWCQYQTLSLLTKQNIFHPYQNHVAIKITKLCIWNMLVILCYQLLSTEKASIKTKYDLATWLLKQSKAALIHIFFIFFLANFLLKKISRLQVHLIIIFTFKS